MICLYKIFLLIRTPILFERNKKRPGYADTYLGNTEILASTRSWNDPVVNIQNGHRLLPGEQDPIS